jgi:malate synthase
MTDYIEKNGLQIDAVLADFVENEAIPGSNVPAEAVWAGMSALVQAFGPKTAELIAKREELQSKIDAWHLENKDKDHDPVAYETYLGEIGYLVAEPADVTINPTNIDTEIASVCGPQLVVPSTNARFALNAANARWGSLYDALYGTDAIGSPPPSGGFDTARGAEVIAWAKAHLDKVLPLKKGSWTDVVTMAPSGGKLMMIAGKGTTELVDPSQFAGYNRDDRNNITDVWFRANGMHIVLFIDRKHPLGKTDTAGIADIFIESALSAIIDLEDSVACVDGPDKVGAYRNWLGLMKGDLTAEVTKGGETFTRELNPDIGCESPRGEPMLFKGRSLLLVRNVGHLMTTPAVLDKDGNEAPEGLVDAIMSILCGVHDLVREDGPKNSPKGSIYIVKPKMHGPEEVALAVQIFEAVEQVLGLPQGTVKIGIMDEERRTSANLKSCIAEAKHRLAFVNTGFLDRTGDEIHTSMEAGPMCPKGDMKSSAWLSAYEDRNVDIAMACGLKGRAQIGKGMWAMPDRMGDMLDQKVGHLKAGATCAWVPSPTAATLHATHYHEIDVFQRLFDISEESKGEDRQPLSALLDIPLAEGPLLDDVVSAEVENNCQSILGYVVRWIDQGIGCSKVPDIHDVGLMEDRATLRISAQGLANWLHHGVISEEQVMAALKKMAEVVDRQNEGDANYTAMAPGFDGVAFQAACDLIFKGRVQPSGYTEPVLHARRAQAKTAG